jgi:hypothetical protein
MGKFRRTAVSTSCTFIKITIVLFKRRLNKLAEEEEPKLKKVKGLGLSVLSK